MKQMLFIVVHLSILDFSSYIFVKRQQACNDAINIGDDIPVESKQEDLLSTTHVNPLHVNPTNMYIAISDFTYKDHCRNRALKT